jgi:hypothetical protein
MSRLRHNALPQYTPCRRTNAHSRAITFPHATHVSRPIQLHPVPFHPLTIGRHKHTQHERVCTHLRLQDRVTRHLSVGRINITPHPNPYHCRCSYRNRQTDTTNTPPTSPWTDSHVKNTKHHTQRTTHQILSYDTMPHTFIDSVMHISEVKCKAVECCVIQCCVL